MPSAIAARSISSRLAFADGERARAPRSSSAAGRCRSGRGSRSGCSAGSRACGRRPSRPRPRRRSGETRAASSSLDRRRVHLAAVRAELAREALREHGRRRRRRSGTARRPSRSGASARSGASFVCSVERTRWPVSAASIEIFAVSPSRISPTITTSGSERRIERSAVANVSPARWLICTWLMPGEPVLDRILDRDDVDLRPVDLASARRRASSTYRSPSAR